MKRTLAVVVLSLMAINLLACGTAATPTPKPTLPAVKVVNKVVAEGKVVPIKGAGLSFQVTGTVAEIPVKVGDKVEAGKPIVILDSKQFEFSLAQAEGNLYVSAAQQAAKSAQAAYDNVLRPTDNEIIALKADVDKAKAQLDRANAAYDRIGGDSAAFANMTAERAAVQTAWLDYQKALALYNNKAQPPDSQVQQSLANLQTAKDNLAKLTPTKEDLAQAEANVKASKAARDIAADNLNRAKLPAPFAGTVLAIDLKVGEQVTIGTPVARVADTSVMQVETTDLTEINIVNVKEGDPVTITLDAIPGFEMTGKVTSIKGYGENRQGDIVYTVVVTLDKQDERLRWNMTAKVTISK